MSKDILRAPSRVLSESEGMVERVSEAIIQAQEEAKERFGSYTNVFIRDSSGVCKPPAGIPPLYWVRDHFIREGDQTIWEGSDNDDCHAELGRVRRTFIARAAIEAMREPTEVMILVGDGQQRAGNPYPVDIAEAWRDMIDEALAETPTPLGGKGHP